jgi:MoaA/NifB/PqqE/SkfB family radical SAM enzyme
MPENFQVDLRLRPQIRTILLLLTNKCNLTCKHCYVGSSPIGSWGLETERVLHLIDEVTDQIGQTLFTLSGGEVLTRAKDTLKIMEYAVDKTQNVQLFTNGILIDRDLANDLSNMDIHIRISIDGGSAKVHDSIRGNGAFKATLKGIDNLLAAGYPLSRLALCATITPDTIDEIENIISCAESLGVQKIRLQNVIKAGRATKFWANIPVISTDTDSQPFRMYFDDFYEQKVASEWNLLDIDEKVSLGQCLNIYSDGAVYPFISYTHNHPINTDGYVGNINSTSLHDILEGEIFSQVILKQFLANCLGPQRSSRSIALIHKSAKS